MTNQKEHRTGIKAFHVLTTLLIIALLVVSGCAPATNPQTQQTADQTIAGLRSFSSVEEYQAFVKDHSSGSSNGGNMYYARDVISKSESAVAVAAPSAVAGVDASGAGSSSDSFSQTNNQVASVDEADIIKTDGEYIYTITGNTIFIVHAVPGSDAKVVATITESNANYPQNLFIYDNKLVVMGSEYGQNAWISARFAPTATSTYTYVYDISNKEKPTLETNYTFEGYYTQARLKDNVMYLVTQSYPEYRTDYPMPLIMKNGVESQMSVDRMFFAPVDYDYPVTMTIHSVDLSSDDDALVGSTGIVVENNQVMYMSDNNIYLAATSYVNEWQIRQDIEQATIAPLLTAEQQALIARIDAVDSDILSSGEKKNKVASVYYERLAQLGEKERTALEDEVDSKLKEKLATYDYFEHTIINKLSYKDGIVTPVASGTIAGGVNNQFSFHEMTDGTLAVATTVHQRWSSFFGGPIALTSEATDTADATTGSADTTAAGVSIADSKIAIIPPRPTGGSSESENMVFTLDANMNVIGSLKGIAKGEQIYSTRFDGDRLYMVTFRQVDPFFVIDLSDVKNPTILGELKLPGFSRYLHPVGNNQVIGLGQDATKDGRVKGLKITLFDASDVANPVELSSYVGNDDYAQSTALFDHHAFLFSAEKELLVIPVMYYNYDYYNNNVKDKSYAGALVFHVDNKSIVLRGLVDHAQGSSDIWSKQVERSLYIGDLLYTKSPNLLRVNNLSDLANVADVKLPIESNPEGIVVY